MSLCAYATCMHVLWDCVRPAGNTVPHGAGHRTWEKERERIVLGYLWSGRQLCAFVMVLVDICVVLMYP